MVPSMKQLARYAAVAVLGAMAWEGTIRWQTPKEMPTVWEATLPFAGDDDSLDKFNRYLGQEIIRRSKQDIDARRVRVLKVRLGAVE